MTCLTPFVVCFVDTNMYVEQKPKISAQLGHTDNIHSVVVSPDRRYALSEGTPLSYEVLNEVVR